MPPLAIIGGIAAAGSIGGAAISAHAANKAASAQANAANYAANLQHQDAAQALAYQKQQDAYNRSIMAPFVATGTSANMTLANLMGLRPNYQTAPNGTPYAPQVNPSQAARDAITGAPDSASAIQSAVAADSNVSPDAATTQQWESQGIPLEYIPLPGGGSIARRTDNDPQTSTDQFKLDANQPQFGPDAQPGNNTNDASNAGFGSLAQGFTEKFQAPGTEGLNEDPGFQARLKLGQEAIERSAAAKGNVLGGGTLKDLMSFNSDQASQEYGNVYNRRMNEYLTRANIFNQNQANTFNRYSALSGGGQVSANQLGLLGNQSAGQVGNTLLTSGAQIGNEINNAAAARASGYVGAGNAYGGALSNLGNSAMSLYMLSRLFPGNVPGSSPSYPGQYGGG